MNEPAAIVRNTVVQRTLAGLACVAALAMFPAIGLTQGIQPDLRAAVGRAIDDDAPRLIETFKDFHRNPELGFMETRTAGIIAKELKSLGYEVTTGIAKTGLVAILRNGNGPTVMYRADMDANAVEEATGFDYASKVRVKRTDGLEVPVAHMCGHDAHVTWMLGMARVMANLRDKWSGTLVLVGQPAEEPITGARAMVENGLYKAAPKPDFFIALHTAPIATGLVLARGGTIQAGTDQIDVTFQGVGGHGSMPQLSRDPVVMGAYAITQYQALVSRVIPPLEMAVVTVGSFQAGVDNNVIPEKAVLKINLRYFSEVTRQKLIAGIRAINDGIARTYGMPEDKLPKMEMKGYSPALSNDDTTVERLAKPLGALLGKERIVTNFPSSTGSEDAHVLVEPHPSTKIAYLAVGVADATAVTAAKERGEVFAFAAHGPNYRVDLASIPLGTKIAAVSVLELLAK